MTDPLQLATVEAHVWSLLQQALAEPQSALRIPVVTNVGLDGLPEARILVLRDVDRKARRLSFYTDKRAPKVRALVHRPEVTWLFYDPATMLQIRATGTITLHHDDEVANTAWADCPLASRIPYLGAVASGQVVDEPAPAEHVADLEATERGRGHFILARCTVEVLDVLQLHPTGHRRARVRPGQAEWIAP